MVSADLEGLLPTHENTDLARFLVLQEFHVTYAPLLPFAGFLHEAEELGPAAQLNEWK